MSSTTPLTSAINALTTYANEITGKSDETLSDAVESLVNGYGGGGGSSVPPWVTSTETITIGANSITNMDEVRNYFSSYDPFAYAYLKTSPDTNNQCVALYGLATLGLRYRGGSIGSASYRSNYDGKLVEGTQYEVWRLS